MRLPLFSAPAFHSRMKRPASVGGDGEEGVADHLRASGKRFVASAEVVSSA